MDPINNPYAPGAGTPPPELAGRDKLLQQVEIAIARIRRGNAAKSVLMVGLRGVGKTVLLDQMRSNADAAGVYSVAIEAPERKSLPALLAPQLRLALLRLSRIAAARDLAQKGLSALAGFAKGLRVKYHDIEVGLDQKPERGLADNGDLEQDLTALLQQVGLAARSAKTAVVLFMDEMQYLKADQFAALISALHRCAQRKLPVTLVGAGLPQLRALAGNAKSYAERLFEYPVVGPLSDGDAKEAIVKPALQHDVEFQAKAVSLIVAETQGYPYFLQEWGKSAWEVARKSPITVKDVNAASIQAIAALDESFFRVRFDRLTPSEKKYLRAMAELGPDQHRSGEIADELGKLVNSLGPVRQSLIAKGMIWSPSHGETAFTVPLFADFMKRIMPGKRWVEE